MRQRKKEERDGCQKSRKERNPCGRLIRACSSSLPSSSITLPLLFFFFFFEFPPVFCFRPFRNIFPGRPDKGERESSQSARSQASHPCKESFSWISPPVLLSILWALCMVRKEEAAGWNSVLPNPQTRGGFDPERAREKQSPPFRRIICQLWVTCSKKRCLRVNDIYPRLGFLASLFSGTWVSIINPRVYSLVSMKA